MMKRTIAIAAALGIFLFSAYAAAVPAAGLTVKKVCDDGGSGWCAGQADTLFDFEAYFDYSVRAESVGQGVDNTAQFALKIGESRSFFGLPFDTGFRVEELFSGAEPWALKDRKFEGEFGSNECALDGDSAIACTGSPDFWDIELTFVNTSVPVPVPGTLALLGVGLVGLAGLRRRR